MRFNPALLARMLWVSLKSLPISAGDLGQIGYSFFCRGMPGVLDFANGVADAWRLRMSAGHSPASAFGHCTSSSARSSGSVCSEARVFAIVRILGCATCAWNIFPRLSLVFQALVSLCALGSGHEESIYAHS